MASLNVFLPLRKEKYDFEDKISLRVVHHAILHEPEEYAMTIVEQNTPLINEVNDNYMTALHFAVISNKLSIIKLLLEMGVDVNIKERRYGRTALHFAVKSKNLEVARLLLDYKSNVNELTKHKSTALHIAIEQKNEDMVRLLLKYDADISLKKFGKSSLHLAAESKSMPIARLLLQRGANSNDICNDTSTALHVALELKDENMVNLLLTYGAKVNVNKFGKSPFLVAVENSCKNIAKLLLSVPEDEEDAKNKCAALYSAFERKDKDMVRIFLEHGVDPNCKKNERSPLHIACEYEWQDIVELLLLKRCYIDEFNRDQVSGLFIALEKRNEELTKLLLSHGASVNIQHNRSGITPLHLSVKYNMLEVSRLLLDRKAKINETSTLSSTPLHIAFEERNLQMVLLLIDYGADTKTPKYGKSLLEIAIESQWPKVVKILLEAGAEVNAFTDDPSTSMLSTAIKQKNLQVFEYLIRHGADVNITNPKCNRTPLQWAASCSWIEAAKILIDRGAHIDWIANDGKTALSIALAKRLEDMVQLLLQCGANIEIKTTNMSPLHIAVEQQWTNVARILLDKGARVNEVTMCSSTPLHIAVQKRDMDMIKLLKSYGADVNHKKNGETLLHTAVASRYTDIVELLLDLGAHIDETNECDPQMFSGLHIALNNGDEKTANLLIERGAYYHVRHTKYGSVPLHIAAKNSCLEICKKLLKYGVKIDICNRDKQTPLHYAVIGNSKASVEFLLDRGANVHLLDKDSKSALHLAFQIRSYSIVELLLAEGADMHKQNIRCGSPFEYAVRTIKDPNMIDLLLDHSCNQKSGFDKTNPILKIMQEVQMQTLSPCCESVLRHFAKVNSIECTGQARNWLFVTESTKEYYNKCIDEIEKLKSDKVYGNVTFFALLIKTTYSLSYLINNENLVESFEQSDYKSKYPIYEKSLGRCIQKGIRMNSMLTKCRTVLSIILKFEFDDIVKERVLYHLNNADLRTLCNLYNELVPN